MSEILFESFSNMKCLDNSQMDYKHFKYYIIDKIEWLFIFFSICDFYHYWIDNSLWFNPNYNLNFIISEKK